MRLWHEGVMVGDQVTRDPNKLPTNTHSLLDLPSPVTFHKTQMPPIKEEEEDELEQSSSEEGDAYVDEEYSLSGTLEPGNPARWACSALLGTIHTAHSQSLVLLGQLTVISLNRRS